MYEHSLSLFELAHQEKKQCGMLFNKAQEEKYKSLYQSKLCIQVSEEPLCSVRMKKGQKLTLWFVKFCGKRVLTRDLKNVFGGNTK